MYGKTSAGFSKDLKEFFAQGGFYPNDNTFLVLAAAIITTIKRLPLFEECNQYLKFMRKMAKVVGDRY